MPSVNIIGSGVIGLLSAHELLNEGYEVHLFDKSLAATESTWAGGGIISPLFPWRYDDAVTELAIHSQSLYANLLSDLKQYSRIDPEYIHSGMLMLDCDDFDKAKLWQQQFDTKIDFIDSDIIALKFSFLTKNVSSAAWMPNVHQIRNPRFAALLIDSLKRRGAFFHENTPIDSINITNNRVSSIVSNNHEYKSSVTLISSGAWTGDLLHRFFPKTELDIPAINPVHGQMLLVKQTKPSFSPIVLKDGKYIIPRSDGHILIGSTTEMIGFKKQTTSVIKQQLIDFATAIIPDLEKAQFVKHWSGLRPGAIKGIPTISRHPEISNLYINAGHYRNGLVTAPASAQLIRQIICEQEPKINAKYFTYTRN